MKVAHEETNDKARRRVLKDGPALMPATVSQLTSEAVLGIPGRRFREWVAAERVAHRRIGKLVVVELTVALRALRAEQDEPREESGAAALRRRAGLRAVGGSR